MAADTPVAIPIFNQLAPAATEIGGGPRTIFQALDFSSTQVIDVNLTLENMMAEFQFVQTLFIDNKLNAVFIDVVMHMTQQTIRIMANRQAYVPVLAATPIMQFRTTGAVIVPVNFINVPMPAMEWQAGP